MPRFSSRPSSAAAPTLSDGAFDPFTSSDAARRELGGGNPSEVHHRTRPKSATMLSASLSGASLPSWPLQEDEMHLSRRSDRSARWPPTPSSLQRPLSAASMASGFPTMREPDVSTAIAGRVDPRIRACKSGGPLHSGAGPDIQQAFANHGAVAPSPFALGFMPESMMPPPPTPPALDLLTEPTIPANQSRSNRSRTKKDEEAEKAAADLHKMLHSKFSSISEKPKPLRMVYAHVRGKCIPIPVGGGKQVMFWLALECTLNARLHPN